MSAVIGNAVGAAVCCFIWWKLGPGNDIWMFPAIVFAFASVVAGWMAA